MAKVTIVADDGVVGVDGVFREVDLSALASTIHAVQWDGARGEIERRSGRIDPINDFSDFEQFVTAWEAAAPPPPPPETDSERRLRLKRHLDGVGQDKRAQAMGLDPNDPSVDSKFRLLLTETAMLINERAAGRPTDPGRLDNELKPMWQAVLELGQAQRDIAVKIDNDTYTTTDDVDNAQEWPA